MRVPASGHMVLDPCVESVQYRHEGLGRICKGVLHAGRGGSELGARNDAVGFELAQAFDRTKNQTKNFSVAFSCEA